MDTQNSHGSTVSVRLANSMENIPFLMYLLIMIIGYRLTPFGFSFFAGDFDGQMLEPAVAGCAVPVLDACRDVHHVAGMQFLGFLAFLLIPATTADTDQHLAAAFGAVMNVPVVPAAWLEGNIEHWHLFQR